MSELFDSLNFQQWPTQCSPAHAGADRPAGSGCSVATALTTDRASQSASTASNSAALRTPDQIHRSFDQHTDGAVPGSSSGGRDWKGGHVYWYAPPSPSLQLQQAERQRTVDRTGALQPLASQAFREELLGDSSRRLNLECTSLSDGRRFSEVESQKGSVSSHSTGLRKRLSRRQFVRRPNGTKSNTHTVVVNESGGIERIMSDLDHHLMFRVGSDGEEEVGGQNTTRDFEKENLQQTLIDRMDRAFSQDEPTQERALISDGLIKAGSAPVARTSHWSRTASMPVRMLDEVSIEDSIDELADRGDAKQQLPGLLGKRDFPHSPSNEVQATSRATHLRSHSTIGIASPGKPIAQLRQGSPNKRHAVAPDEDRSSLVSMKRRGMARTVSDGAQRINQTVVASETRVRNRHHMKPSSPIKKAVSAPLNRSLPRLGLSRSAAVSGGASQQCGGGMRRTQLRSLANGTASGPSAPFKQPTRRNPRKNAIEPVMEVPQRTSEPAIVLTDDSSDDEQIGRRGHVPPASRSADASHVAVIKPKGDGGRQTIVEEGDSSFDTSLDEMALCHVLDEVEATQEEARISQGQQVSEKKDAAVQPSSDDSFASIADEDDDISAAILCRMDAEGW